MADWTTSMGDLGDLALYLDPDRRAPHPLDIQQKRQQMAQQESMHPLQIIQQELYNKTMQQALEQGQQLFPGQLKGQQQALAQETAAAPTRNLANLVGALGGQVGADAFVGQYPQEAQQMFGPSSVPMLGAQGTLPSVAADAGRRLYNTGPEVARQLNLAGGMFPLQMQAAREGFQNAKDVANIHGQWYERGQAAGRTFQREEKDRQSAGVAAQVFMSSPAVSVGLPALVEAAAQDKGVDEKSAETLIRQATALRSQIAIAGANAKQIAALMGASNIIPQIDAMMQQQLAQLDSVHQSLYKKYWQNTPATPGAEQGGSDANRLRSGPFYQPEKEGVLDKILRGIKSDY